MDEIYKVALPGIFTLSAAGIAFVTAWTVTHWGNRQKADADRALALRGACADWHTACMNAVDETHVTLAKLEQAVEKSWANRTATPEPDSLRTAFNACLHSGIRIRMLCKNKGLSDKYEAATVHTRHTYMSIVRYATVVRSVFHCVNDDTSDASDQIALHDALLCEAKRANKDVRDNIKDMIEKEIWLTAELDHRAV